MFNALWGIKKWAAFGDPFGCKNILFMLIYSFNPVVNVFATNKRIPVNFK